VTYKVKVVDNTGAAVFGAGPDAGFLPNVEVEPFGHELNRPGFGGFTVHPKDELAIEPKVVEREVQIFRDETFAGWFVPTRRERRRGPRQLQVPRPVVVPRPAVHREGRPHELAS
jgi:hypothetical protein